MRIIITSYYSGNRSPFRRIEDFFLDVNANYFMNVIKHRSISSYDQAFKFNVCSISFEEPYQDGLFGGGAEKAERSVRRKCNQYLRHLERIKAVLPPGITMQFEEDIRVDNHQKRLHLRLETHVSSTAEYSKKCYAAISDGNIVHDWDMPESLINAAKAFKDRVLSCKSDIIHAIKETSDNLRKPSSASAVKEVYFFATGYYTDIFNELHFCDYHSHGMMELSRMEQCYGLAWAVAELSAPTRYFLKVVNDATRGKVVLLERHEKAVTPPPPKYAEW